MRATLAAALAAVAVAMAGPGSAQPATTGLQTNVVFTVQSPLTGDAEVMRRVLSPLAAAGIERRLQAAGAVLADQPIDLTKERFLAYVPAPPPGGRYGLIVFVPPWPDATLPKTWTSVLDRNGVIFVTAARSGNDVTTLGRREPLALLGAVNVMQRYPVDPARVYIAGLSGGSRVAMRLAIAYPDLFRGAILNAGSDPVGGPEMPLPPPDLMQRVQDASGFVYVTGDADSAVLADDDASRASLRAICVFNLTVEAIPGMGHDLAPADALARALKTLDAPAHIDSAKLAACRANLDRQIDAGLGRVAALVAAGQRDQARSRLADIDRRFGGLAAPRSVALSAALAGP
jgi:pimeloyl-ACP methyl ester carboxylesterase